MRLPKKHAPRRRRTFNLRVSRREFLKQLGGTPLASTAITSIAALPQKTFAQIPGHRRVNIGTFGPSHCSTPFVYAKLRGIYTEHGLDVNLINYSDMLLIAKDLVNGTIDFGQLIVPLVFAIHTGKSSFRVYRVNNISRLSHGSAPGSRPLSMTPPCDMGTACCRENRLPKNVTEYFLRSV